MFNKTHWRAAGALCEEDKPENPITKTVTLSILKRAREILRKHLKMPRGELTRTVMTEKHDLQLARKHLERHFPMLGLAESQWAATCFLQEAARRDRKKGGGRSRDIMEGDWEGRKQLEAVWPEAKAELAMEERLEHLARKLIRKRHLKGFFQAKSRADERASPAAE